MYPLFKKNAEDILKAVILPDENTVTQKNSEQNIQHAYKILELWKHWDTIMGSPIKDMLSPVDTKNSTLLLTTTDSIALQEAHYYKEEILDKAHAFLGAHYFNTISIRHSLGEDSLTEEGKAPSFKETYTPTVETPLTTDSISSNPVIQKAYMAFLERMKKN